MMKTREVFREKGTQTFNPMTSMASRTIMGFQAPGGMPGEGNAACVGCFGGWFAAFPDAQVKIKACHFAGDVAVEEGTFTGTQSGILYMDHGQRPANGTVRRSGVHPPLSRWQAHNNVHNRRPE